MTMRFIHVVACRYSYFYLAFLDFKVIYFFIRQYSERVQNQRIQKICNKMSPSHPLSPDILFPSIKSNQWFVFVFLEIF